MTMSKKSLVLAHFVLVNTSRRVDSLDSEYSQMQLSLLSKRGAFSFCMALSYKFLICYSCNTFINPLPEHTMLVSSELKVFAGAR